MDSSVQKTSTILIEISGVCNAKCPYCAQRRLRQGKHFGGIMSPILFEQILDHLFEIEILDKANTCIALFNWGEPFLNPEINTFLQILRMKKLCAGISSNFISVPDLDNECIPVIRGLTFSLSGFSQDSYGRIHGASLKRTLSNFENFYAKIRRYSPETYICIHWHRYLFNERELWNAYRYFNRPGIIFNPQVAYLNDLIEMMDFIRGELSEDRKKQAEKDIFLDFIREGVGHSKKKSKNYQCPAWNFLVIDETGQLLLCCGMTRYDSDHVLGNILKMSAEEIWRSKFTDSFCNECLSSGLAQWAYNQRFRNKPLPSGGGLYRLKLWFQHDLKSLVRSELGRMLRKLPNGEKIIYIIKRL